MLSKVSYCPQTSDSGQDISSNWRSSKLHRQITHLPFVVSAGKKRRVNHYEKFRPVVSSVKQIDSVPDAADAGSKCNPTRHSEVYSAGLLLLLLLLRFMNYVVACSVFIRFRSSYIYSLLFTFRACSDYLSSLTRFTCYFHFCSFSFVYIKYIKFVSDILFLILQYLCKLLCLLVTYCKNCVFTIF